MNRPRAFTPAARKAPPATGTARRLAAALVAVAAALAATPARADGEAPRPTVAAPTAGTASTAGATGVVGPAGAVRTGGAARKWPQPGTLSVALRFGSRALADGGAAWLSDGSDLGNFGVEAGVVLARPTARLSLAALAGWSSFDALATPPGLRESRLAGEEWLVGGLARWQVIGPLAGLAGLRIGAARADATVDDLTDRSWAAVGRAFVGGFLHTPPSIVATLPVAIELGVGVEVGYTVGTPWSFGLVAPADDDDRIPAGPVAIGDLSPRGRDLAVTLRAAY